MEILDSKLFHLFMFYGKKSYEVHPQSMTTWLRKLLLNHETHPSNKKQEEAIFISSRASHYVKRSAWWKRFKPTQTRELGKLNHMFTNPN